MSDDHDEDLTGPVLDPADDAAVTLLLAGLPELTMPDDVAARIAAALAGEVPLSGPVPAWAADGATNVSVLPSQREREQRKHARRGRVLSAAAAVVLVLGAVAFGTQFFQGDGTDANTNAGGGPVVEGTNGAPAEAALLTSSNTAYDQADLAPQVSGLVKAASLSTTPKTVIPPADSASSPPAPSPGASAATMDVRDITREPLSVLAVCVAKLGGAAGEQPVAVDTGTWTSATVKAEPVAVVVLGSDNPKRVDVFVVTAGCGDPAVVDDTYVVYFATVARP